ncbi:multidrug efflux system transcriptional repressor MtrR [Neisseria musculi]|uniref:Bacterial regulatory tetR family protein n=1 Tax=Neisseria musculi TaxID=1815583 RepID=A0A7H1M848_9NEIS|nr:TetR family transcriptional regulator [Neisseria musculi]QNT57813.1 bacterial regulatory, tetR family protein [Neisseria musculi]
MRKTKAEAMKTREYLILAALDTFYQKGVARASLNEIAQNAGVTRGALYWHFKNKEDLFDALFQRLCDEVAGSLEADLNNDDADMWENMHVSLINMLHRIENDPIHYKFSSVLHLKCERTDQNQAITAVIDKYENMWHDLLDAILKQCIKQHSLPADLDTALARLYLKSAIHGLIYQRLVNPERASLKENGPRFVQAVLGSLRQCPTLRKPPA